MTKSIETKQSHLLPLDLQFFAEDNTKKDAADNKQDSNADNKQDDNNQSEQYTKEAFEKMLQSEADKIRTKYSKEASGYKKELEDLKKAKMTEDEKKKFEDDQREQELLAKEAALLEKELTLKAIDLLTTEGLPLDAKQFLIGKDEDSTVENVAAFKKMFDAAVAKEVEATFKKKGTEHKQSEGNGSITKEQFMKMGYLERAKIANENPELYKSLAQ